MKRSTSRSEGAAVIGEEPGVVRDDVDQHTTEWRAEARDLPRIGSSVVEPRKEAIVHPQCEVSSRAIGCQHPLQRFEVCATVDRHQLTAPRVRRSVEADREIEPTHPFPV